MTSLEEVQHIAALARISLSKEEAERFQKEFTVILDYFQILQELDTSHTNPMSHSLSIQNGTRQDVAKPLDSVKAKKLLDMAPSSERGYLKITSIL